MDRFKQGIRIIIDIIQFTISLLARDKKSLVILLLMPFILIAVLGASLSGVMNEGFTYDKAKIAIVDDDHTLPSGLLINSGFKNEEVGQHVEIEELKKEEAEKKFSMKQLDGILYIHKGYGYNFIYGIQDKLVLKMNPVKTIQATMIKEILNQYHILGKMVIDAVNAGRPMTQFPSVNSMIEDQALQLQVQSAEAGQKRIDSFQYYAIGMGVMYTLFTMFTGVGFILNERKQHTLNRIKIMPFPTRLFYIGKSLAFMIISFLQLFILFVSSHYAFGVSFGEHPFYMLIVMLAYSLATSGIMVFLLGWINNQNTLNVFFSMGVPVIAALGGSMVPVALFPSFVEPISNILPNRWAMEGFFQVMLGRPNEALQPILFLILFAAVALTIGIWKLSRKGAETL